MTGITTLTWWLDRGGALPYTAPLQVDATQTTVARLAGHEEAVTTVAFSPDGARLLTASHDNKARIWDASSGRVAAVLAGHSEWLNSAAFSPDGESVVTPSP